MDMQAGNINVDNSRWADGRGRGVGGGEGEEEGYGEG